MLMEKKKHKLNRDQKMSRKKTVVGEKIFCFDE